jgi:anti-sigma-K factor RskA
MHDKITSQLSALLDGELNRGEREAVESHLATCAECRQALEAIRAVKSWAPNYEGVAPTRDLWQSIEPRLGTRPIGSGAMKPAWHGRRVSVRLPLLAAAAIALLVVGAAATRLFISGSQSEVARTDSAPGVVIPVKHWDPAQEQQTNSQYDTAIAELEAILASNGDALEPATLKVIHESLATIDRAIAAARQAIARDSTNDYLNASIAENMRRKLGILRMAAQAATAKS